MIYTIGHSRHSWEWFLSLITRHNIIVLVDVRRVPYSKIAPQFNKDKLKANLEKEGIKYLYRGKFLGGEPGGQLKWERVDHQFKEREQQPEYQRTLEWLIHLSHRERVGLLCAEANPRACHRHHIIARSLLQRGEAVAHILEDGEIDQPSLGEFKDRGEQLELF